MIAGMRRRAAGRSRAVTPQRRRIYLMRHAQVRYFEGVQPEQVMLDGRRPPPGSRRRPRRSPASASTACSRAASRARSRPRASSRPASSRRSTARCARSRAATSAGSTPTKYRTMMATAFRGVVPLETQFLGGETIGELFDRVLPGARRAPRRPELGRRPPRPPRRRQPRDPRPGDHRRPDLPRRLRAVALLHQRPRRGRRRRIHRPRRQPHARTTRPTSTPRGPTTMEHLWARVPRGTEPQSRRRPMTLYAPLPIP